MAVRTRIVNFARWVVLTFAITPGRAKIGVALLGYFAFSWAYTNWSLGFPNFSLVNVILQSILGVFLFTSTATMGWIAFSSTGKNFALETLNDSEPGHGLVRIIKVALSAGAIALSVTLLIMIFVVGDRAVAFFTDYFHVVIVLLFIAALPFASRYLK